MMYEIDTLALKQARKKRFWCQQDLAQAAGLSERTIQRLESGQPASLETLKALAAAFDVDPNALIKQRQAFGLKWGLIFGFGGTLAGFAIAIAAILQAAHAGEITFSDAGRYGAIVGLLSGVTGASLGIATRYRLARGA